MSPSGPGTMTILRRVLPVLAAAVVIHVASAAGSLGAQPDPTDPPPTTAPPTTAPPPPTTAPPPPTTAPPPPTTAPPPPTTAPPPPTTAAPTTTASTTTTSTTSTTAPTTTTEPSDDGDDGSSIAWWIALGLLGLAVLGGIAWLVMRKTRQHDVAASWGAERAGLLDEARRSHDSVIDLLARWSSLDREQLYRRWSHEMGQLERLRTHLSTLMAHAPVDASSRSMQRVATAVDDVRMALGDADVTPTSEWSVVPPPAPTHATAACDALDQAITEAQQGGR